MSFLMAVAQTNPVPGDLAGNACQIAAAARKAHAQGAQLVAFATGALAGPQLHDLAQRTAFAQACAQQVQALADELATLSGLTVVLPHGAEIATDGHAGHACSVLHAGQCRTHGANGAAICAFDVRGRPLRIAALPAERWCDADAEHARSEALERIRRADAGLVLVLGNAPYRMGQAQAREQSLTTLARQAGLPVVSAHLVGGQGERVYDGASLAVQANGNVAGRAAQFAQDVWLVAAQVAANGWTLQATTAPITPADALVGATPESARFAQPFSHVEVWHALVLGLRDYVRKSGFRTVALGLSGGMDSALVLALAVDALGREHVRTLMLPSAYTADISLADAAEMARRLGVRHDVLPIAPLCQAFDAALAPLFAGMAADVTEENIQARVRGSLLMALSNKTGALVLATGNKSELSVGYCTLYGDMAGALAPLKDVFKTQVYALARWRNAHDPFGTGASPIPDRIITRAPSAELRPGQTDQDSLPPYEVLDAILAGYMECDATLQQLCAAGLPADAVQKVLRLVRNGEYKRWQAAPGLCISRRGYGCDWRYPLLNRFAEEQ